MKEYTFICPHCGKAVEVDENGYAAIIKQIRDDVFQADLEEQKRVMETEREKAVELAKRRLSWSSAKRNTNWIPRCRTCAVI